MALMAAVQTLLEALTVRDCCCSLVKCWDHLGLPRQYSDIQAREYPGILAAGCHWVVPAGLSGQDILVGMYGLRGLKVQLWVDQCRLVRLRDQFDADQNCVLLHLMLGEQTCKM